jgi:hypothetical protein
MPRKQKPVIIDVNRRRADNYQWHFSCRQYAKNHPYQTEIAACLRSLPRPTLDIFGSECLDGRPVGSYPEQNLEGFFSLAARFGLESACWMMYWYWSDQGWQEFEMQWQALPEVVHIPMCTNGKVVLFCTQEEYLNAPGTS